MWLDSFLWAINELSLVAQASVVFIFSLLIGSFLNVVIYRLPIMLSRDWESQAREILSLPSKTINTFNLLQPKSCCRKCNHPISALKNIPIISYLIIGGKCSHCGEKISIFYPITELLTAVLTTFVFLHFGANTQGYCAIFLVYTLVTLTAIDSKTQLLPDIITLPLMWAGIVLSFFNIYISLEIAVLGAIIGYMSFWIIRWLFLILFKKDGLGMGDAKLLAAIFTWAHIQYLPIALIIACFLGLVITAMTGLYNKQNIKGQTIPFGPYLCIAGLVVFLYGEPLQQIIEKIIL